MSQASQRPMTAQPDRGGTHPVLRVASDRTGADLRAARRAAAGFLSALGIDPDREELRDAPGRMARAYAEPLHARPLRLTTFPNDEGYDELVVLEAEHSCMTLRGVRAHGAKTVTSALLGTLRADPRSRAEFFALAGVPSSP